MHEVPRAAVPVKKTSFASSTRKASMSRIISVMAMTWRIIGGLTHSVCGQQRAPSMLEASSTEASSPASAAIVMMNTNGVHCQMSATTARFQNTSGSLQPAKGLKEGSRRTVRSIDTAPAHRCHLNPERDPAMNANHLHRLLSAALAACTTLVLFSAVVSISEPQRSELMAKGQGRQPQAATRLAAASAPVASAVVR